MGKRPHKGGSAPPHADPAAFSAIAAGGAAPLQAEGDEPVEDHEPTEHGETGDEGAAVGAERKDATDPTTSDAEVVAREGEVSERRGGGAVAAAADEATQAPQTIVESATAAAPRVRLVVGQELTCDNFEGGLVVRATVVDVHGGIQALLSMSALQRRWPILLERVTGQTWCHVPGDYPQPGHDSAFDSAFRPPIHPEEPTAVTDEYEAAEPPRRARMGHVWAVTQHHVGAIGYDAEGAARTSWTPQQLGEFRCKVVDNHSQAFKRL